MKRIAYPAGVILIGMVVSHALFTVLVYLSDLDLYETARGLKAAGYLVVPNEPVLSGLTRIWPAFCGAFFFTFTTGAGLSLLAFAAAWMHRRLFGSRNAFFAVVIAAWSALIIMVNAKGWNIPVTSAFVLIPALVFSLALHWMPTDRMRGDRLVRIIHIVVILVVAAAWVPRLDGSVFINIRDYLLLENPAGKAVNTFYYRYTLYPAELFKTLDQKLQKAVFIDGVSSPDTARKISDKLRTYDYLPVGSDMVWDLKIQQKSEHLLFSDPGRSLVHTRVSTFLSQPKTILQECSEKSDVNGFLRLFTFFSLVTAFPLTLYVLVHALLGIAFGMLVRSVSIRSVLASLVCLAIGIGAVIPLYAGTSGPMTVSEIPEKLASGDWRQQRAALKAISDEGIDPLRYEAFDRKWLHSPHVPVRYWLTQSLGNSRRPEAFRMLLESADDPHPNVACMAYYGLGRSGNRRAVDVILSRMPEIRHWYVQWYAYKSLKRLGWQQKRSDMITGR